MKILQKINLENLINSIRDVIRRFPIGMTLILFISLIFFSLLHGDFSNSNEEILVRMFSAGIITFFLNIGANLYLESKSLSKIKEILIQISTLLFGIFFYSAFKQDLDNIEFIIFFIITLSGILSFLFFAPYIKNIFKNDLKQSIFYTYFYNISVILLTSFILGGILFGLGTIGISSVFELFDISWSNHSELIGDWAIISLAIISPIFALSSLPNKKSFTNNHFNENAFFSFVTKYIAIPFIYIYFIILYAYTVKVLSNFGDWPKGEVSWMVIGFSTFGYIIYLYSYIFEQKNKFIATFRKAFPYVVVPQLFMLAYAIYLRINQYDITINRYFVVVFGIWLLTISLYYIFSKKKQLVFIPAILTLFTIIISVGPWSVYNLPESRQFDRLETNLTEAGILKNGVIYPLNNYNEIDKELSKDIYSGIDYLCNLNSCNSIKELFKVQYEEIYKIEEKNWEENKQKNLKRYQDAIEKYKDTDKERSNQNLDLYNELYVDKYVGPNKWTLVGQISEKIKVEMYHDSGEKKTLRFDIDGHNSMFPLKIEGFKSIYILDSYKNNYDSGSQAYIDLENHVIEYKENGIEKKVDINFIIEKLISLNNSGKVVYTKEDLIFETTGIKIILNNINILDPEYKGDRKNTYLYANGYILTK